MNTIRFIGNWDSEEQEEVHSLLIEKLSRYSGVTVTCLRDTGKHAIPYKAQVRYQGETYNPVAYGGAVLVENIMRCLPMLYPQRGEE